MTSDITDIVGHAVQREQFLNDCTQDNLAHAYLFTGQRHVGKMTLARWCAVQILTQGLDIDAAAKEQKRIAKMIHPDVLVVDQLWIDGVCTDWNVIAQSSNISQQHRAKEPKAKSDVIGVEDVRVLQERLHESSETGRTCCIIRSLERLHPTAANALLKIIEEPPAGTVFLCTTESPSSVLDTLLSRMRIVHLFPVMNADLLPLVKGIGEDDATLILGIAQGSPGIVKQCVENPDRLQQYKEMAHRAQEFLTHESSAQRAKMLQEVLKENEQHAFLQHLLLHLQRQLRSQDASSARTATQQIAQVHALLHGLQSNAQKQLLALNTALTFA